MTRHKRIPAALAALLTAALGIALFAATGQFRKTDLDHLSLADIEKQIIGSQDAKIWAAYGDKLRAAGRNDSAAKAYQRALEIQPDLPAARLNQGLALAATDPEAFFEYAGRLSMNYPKLAVNLLDRPELAPLHANPRWETTYTAAQAQAAD